MSEKNHNYLMKIEYDGSKFVGWQYQKNGKSVQEVIEKALSKFFKSKIKINGAGRTDKGVHAIGQHANFKVSKKIENEKKFLNSINFFLSSNSRLVANGFPKRTGISSDLKCLDIPKTKADLPLKGSQEPIIKVLPMTDFIHHIWLILIIYRDL